MNVEPKANIGPNTCGSPLKDEAAIKGVENVRVYPNKRERELPTTR